MQIHLKLRKTSSGLEVSGESGEVADALKKMYRKYGSMKDAPVEVREHILKECGDTLWYLNRLTNILGSSLEEVAKMNIKKLQKRKEQGTLIDSSKREKTDV